MAKIIIFYKIADNDTKNPQSKPSPELRIFIQ